MDKLTALRTSVLDAGADALLVTSGVNQRYLTGFKFDDGHVLITKDKAYVITDFRYIEAARVQVRGEYEVLMPQSGRAGFIMSLLTENNVKVLAFEDNNLSCAQYGRFRELYAGISLVPSGMMIEKLRECKDGDEIAAIAKAQDIADEAFVHILKFIFPEMTEIEVALELEFFMRRAGSEGVSFDTICISGSATSLPHGTPRNRKLQGGFLTMDFGAVTDGYRSDMTRTVVLGRADGDMKKIYNTVLSAQTAALDFICEGADCRECDAAARSIIYSAGYEGCFGHGLGHGVGLEIHESPRLSPNTENIKLREGNVFTIEPGIYINDKYGCRIEDMAVINGGRVRNFTHSTKEMIELF